MAHEKVIIIGEMGEADSKTLKIQDFVANGASFIPVFTDLAHFRSEAKGTGFEDRGIEVDRHFLAGLLRGDEVLIVNPGSDRRRITKADLAGDQPLV